MSMVEKEVPVGTFDNMVLGPNGALYEKERMSIAEATAGTPLLDDLARFKRTRDLCGISASTYMILLQIMEFKHGEPGKVVLEITQPEKMSEFISRFSLESYRDANRTLERLLSDTDYLFQVGEEYKRDKSAKKKHKIRDGFLEYFPLYIALTVGIFVVLLLVLSA